MVDTLYQAPEPSKTSAAHPKIWFRGRHSFGGMSHPHTLIAMVNLNLSFFRTKALRAPAVAVTSCYAGIQKMKRVAMRRARLRPVDCSISSRNPFQEGARLNNNAINKGEEAPG